MKRLNQYVLLMGAVVLLSGCGQRAMKTAIPAYEVENTTQISQISSVKQKETEPYAAYVEQFCQGDFDPFCEAETGYVTKKTDKKTLETQWQAVAEKARDYVGELSTEKTETDQGSQIKVTTVHRRYQIETVFTRTKEGQVEQLSFSLLPLIVKPESTSLWQEVPVTLGYDENQPLNGMLTLPRQVEAAPVVLLVHGSGGNNMDSLIGAADNRPFADLAHGLAEQGIASLRYDKRSYTYPEDVKDVETEYLWDVTAAVQWLSQDERVDKERIFLIGHSQGGLLAPKLALDNPQIKGIVSMGGTLRRLEDMILEQNQTMMDQDLSLTAKEKELHMKQVGEMVNRIKGLNPQSRDDKDELLFEYPISYWISLNQIDSRALATELTIPMLILQGDNDFQVLYETDFLLWQKVLKDKEHVSFVHYPGLSHVFMPGSRQRFDSSSYDTPAHMDSQVIQDIANWIADL